MKAELTVAEVVSVLRQNDERQHSRALHILYKTHGYAIRQFIRQRGGSKEEAEEILSQALMSFFENVRAGKFEQRADVRLSTYLHTLALYAWLKQLRKNSPWQGNTQSLQQEWATDIAQQEVITSEQHALFYEMVAQLGDRCQELIRLVIEGFSMQDIAVRLHFTNADNAKAQKYRCLQQIKELYKRHL